jgi:pyruvate/2-oxoglutarate/acetoin dehydrogenase E1 component
MYGGGKTAEQAIRIPMVVRTPMGGRRGYGPTHSQTLEKHFLGVPGLRVLAPCSLGDPGTLLKEAILNGQDPTLFIENKLLYLLPIQDGAGLEEFDLQEQAVSRIAYSVSREEMQESWTPAPTYALALRGAPPPNLTLATYGYMAELARQAALRLAYEHEIFVELVVPTQLAPFEIELLLASARRTGRLLAVEEGALSLGWGAEVLARAVEALGPSLEVARRLAALDLPVPASEPLEAVVLPGVDEIVQIAQKMVT